MRAPPFHPGSIACSVSAYASYWGGGGGRRRGGEAVSRVVAGGRGERMGDRALGGRGGESVSAWMYVQYVPCGPPAPGAHLHWGVTNAHVRRRPSYAHRQWWVPGAGMAAACAGQGRWRAPRRGAPRAGAATRCGTGCGCPLATGNAHRPPPTPTVAARPQNHHPCAPLCPPPPPPSPPLPLHPHPRPKAVHGRRAKRT